MNVLLIVPRLNPPPPLFVYRHIHMLAESGVLAGIAVVRTKKEDPHAVDGVPVYPLGPRGLFERVWRSQARRLHLPVRFPSPAERLRRVLERIHADAILCEFGRTAQWAGLDAFTAQVPTCIHVHGFDTYVELTPPNYRGFLTDIAHSARIICNSTQTYQRLRAWDIDEHALVIKTPGVEIPPQPSIRSARADDLTILHLGRLIDCKAPDKTIQAFERACEQGFRGRLVIAGDGPYRERCETLRQQSRWRDAIELRGEVSAEQGAALREQADIFTLHSIKGEQTGQIEAFGVSVVEAMAAGLPVVSCAIGGLLETVVDGETGFLVEPGDVEAQAQAFLTLARNPELRRSMGRAGWIRARDQFSYAKEKAELLAILAQPSR